MVNQVGDLCCDISVLSFNISMLLQDRKVSSAVSKGANFIVQLIDLVDNSEEHEYAEGPCFGEGDTKAQSRMGTVENEILFPYSEIDC